MGAKRKIVDLLPIMVAAFPQTFFTHARQVRPLQVDIYQELVGNLPAGMSLELLKRFMYWYTHRPAYQQALSEGRQRVDLTGADAGEVDDAIRQQAQARWEALRQGLPSAVAMVTPQPAEGVSPVPVPAFPIRLEELYAMAVDAKLQITLKFSTLPNARPAGQGQQVFALKTPDGQYVTVAVSNKLWNKLVKAAADWPVWVAALSGTMGQRTEKGFALVKPSLQVFERKPKATAEASPPVEAKPAPTTATAVAPAAALPAAATVAPSPATPPTADPTDPGASGWRPKLSLKNRAEAG